MGAVSLRRQDERIAPCGAPLQHRGTGNLARPGGAAQLPNHLANRVPSGDMAFRQEAARRVDGQRAAELDPSALDPRRSLARPAIAEPLEREYDERREGIISVEALHVLARHAGLREHFEVDRTIGRAAGGLLIDAETARGEDELVAAGTGSLHADDADRFLAQIPRAVAARDEDHHRA